MKTLFELFEMFYRMNYLLSAAFEIVFFDQLFVVVYFAIKHQAERGQVKYSHGLLPRTIFCYRQPEECQQSIVVVEYSFCPEEIRTSMRNLQRVLNFQWEILTIAEQSPYSAHLVFLLKVLKQHTCYLKVFVRESLPTKL